MQIVIDIPEDIIEGAKTSPNYYPTYHFEKIWRAIVNGIPLPKGHGDLIDEDALIEVITNGIAPNTKEGGFKHPFDIIRAVNNMKPIIKADKAESEGKE